MLCDMIYESVYLPINNMNVSAHIPPETVSPLATQRIGKVDKQHEIEITVTSLWQLSHLHENCKLSDNCYTSLAAITAS